VRVSLDGRPPSPPQPPPNPPRWRGGLGGCARGGLGGCACRPTRWCRSTSMRPTSCGGS
jgi:hypothetical protein